MNVEKGEGEQRPIFNDEPTISKPSASERVVTGSSLDSPTAVLVASLLAHLTVPVPFAVGSIAAGISAGILGRRWVESHAPFGQITEVEALASAVIGDRTKAVKWLAEPNLTTDNRPPIDLMGEEQGFERVKNLLLRIEHGDLA